MFGWWQRRPRLPDLDVTLYTRAACPLCDKAAVILRTAQRRYGFPIATTDIDADPALVAKYGWLVPVVVIGGRERFRGHVNPVLFERLLRAEVAARSR